MTGYGADKYCESAKVKIRKACESENADVYFLVGGTQTNALVINSMLQSYEGVIAAETGHISVHEAGAIELTGHKVLTLSHHNGKIDVNEVKGYLQTFYADKNHEHMVFPGMVYISHPTEYGTLYTKNELTEISEICKKYAIPLFLTEQGWHTGLWQRIRMLHFQILHSFVMFFILEGQKLEHCLEKQLFLPKITHQRIL